MKREHGERHVYRSLNKRTGKFSSLQISYKTGPFRLSDSNLEAVHSSDGVKVIAWPRAML